MTTFLWFVLVAIAYAAAMSFLGRTLRARGHGSKLDAMRDRHQRMLERLRAPFRGRSAKRQRGTASITDDQSQ